MLEARIWADLRDQPEVNVFVCLSVLSSFLSNFWNTDRILIWKHYLYQSLDTILIFQQWNPLSKAPNDSLHEEFPAGWPQGPLNGDPGLSVVPLRLASPSLWPWDRRGDAVPPWGLDWACPAPEPEFLWFHQDAAAADQSLPDPSWMQASISAPPPGNYAASGRLLTSSIISLLSLEMKRSMPALPPSPKFFWK